MLESEDAATDARDFDAAGIAASKALEFERAGVRPDGGKLKVGFSLAFARDAGAPAIGFATCRQHNPESFWNRSLQQHPNGASAIASAVIVAENPSDHHIFLSAFTGERGLQATSSGITARTPRGDLAVMDAAAFRSHFGVQPPDLAGGAQLAAIGFTVRERAALIAALSAGTVPHILHMGHVVVAPEAALGATLVFGTQGDFGPG
jgi:hypothetical protein